MADYVILGAGYAGISAARQLGKKVTSADTIQLISPHPYQQLLPTFPGPAVGRTGFRHALASLAVLLPKNVTFVEARVAQLDPVQRLITTNHGTISYTHLLISLGSQVEDFGIPGVKQHTFSVQNVTQAARLRHALSEGVTDAPIVVAGAGLTGVEVAAELREVYRDRPITVVEAAASVLPGQNQRLIDYVAEQLRDMNIEVHLSTPIQRVEEGGVVIADGSLLPSAVTIWATGVRGPRINQTLNLPLSRKDRLVVNSFLQVAGFPEIFAAGDCAEMLDADTGRPYPPSAQLAVQAGELMAENAFYVSRSLPLKPLKPQLLGMAISLGTHKGIAKVGKFYWYGLAALLLKEAAKWRYLFKVGGVASFFSATDYKESVLEPRGMEM